MKKILVRALMAGSLLAASSSHAAVILIDIEMAYSVGAVYSPDNAKGMVFEMLYDTSKNANSVFVPAGSHLPDGSTALDPVYGYSAAGVVAARIASIKYINQPVAVSGQYTYANQPADLYFDADITQATPSKFAATFNLPDGTLSFGGFSSGANTTPFNSTMVYSTESVLLTGHILSIYRSVREADPIAAVPEPETFAMLLAGLGLVGATVRRRKSRV